MEEGGCRDLRGLGGVRGALVVGGGRAGRLVTQRKISQIRKYIKDSGTIFLTIRKGSYNYEKGQI